MIKDLGINRITPSMLVEYENCPRLFYYRSWLGLQLPTPKIHLKFGTAIHSIIDEMYTYPNREFNEKIIFESIKSKFPIESIDDKEYTEFERTNKHNEMILDGVEMLKQFHQEKEILWAKGVQPIRMELPLKLDIFDPKTKQKLEVPMSLRLDGETENGNIIEFKTSSAKYDVFETHLSNQARSYVLAQYCRTGRIPEVHYVILIKKRKNEKIQHLHLHYDEADLLAFYSKIGSMLEQIKNREFNIPARGHMNYCDCIKINKILKKHESKSTSI